MRTPNLPWFDDFTKGLAGGSSRTKFLRGAASVAAGLAVGPATGFTLARADDEPRTTRSTRGTAARSARGMAHGIKGEPQTLTQGVCEFTFGKTGKFAAAFDAGAFHFSIQHHFTPTQTSASGPIQLSAGATLLITSGDSASSRVKMSLPSIIAGQTNPDITATFHYATSSTTSHSAVLHGRGDTVTGEIDGKRIAALSRRTPVPATAVRLEDGSTLKRPTASEEAVQRDLSALAPTIKSQFTTCYPRAHRLQPASRRRSIEAFDIADAPSGEGGTQNGADIGSGTHSCHDGLQGITTALGVCLGFAGASGIFCPPCVVPAVEACYGAFASAYASLFVPVAGLCNQVPCGLNANVETTNFAVRSCDKNSTCCGTNLCCGSTEVCTKQTVCCPASAPVGCGDERPFCCSSGSVCGSDGTCFSCPAGSTPLDNVCCPTGRVCGKECCIYGQTCNAKTQTCDAPFGKSTPRPAASGNTVIGCARISGLVPCQSLNADGSKSSVCCKPNVTCCNGTCCDPGMQCGGPNLTCGRWIR